jgi:hypothetical protein
MEHGGGGHFSGHGMSHGPGMHHHAAGGHHSNQQHRHHGDEGITPVTGAWLNQEPVRRGAGSTALRLGVGVALAAVLLLLLFLGH